MSEIQEGNTLNKNTSKTTHVKNTTFPINYHLYGTYRFGEYGYCFGFNGLAGDKVKVHQRCTVDTYSLKAPLLTPITMQRTYIQVPRMAIIPNAWDNIYTDPKFGDDIDASQYGTSVPASVINSITDQITTSVKQTIIDFRNTVTGQTPTVDSIRNGISDIINYLTIAELIFSNGSLINAMGAHLNILWKDRKKTFDERFEEIINSLTKNFGSWTVEINNNDQYEIILNPTESGLENIKTFASVGTILTINQLLEKLRDGDKMNLLSAHNTNGNILTNYNQWTPLFTDFNEIADDIDEWQEGAHEITKPIDIAPLWAYQLSCAEFFTNDNVDYIYNAEKFRNYIKGLIIMHNGGTLPTDMFYTLNGIRYEADALSSKAFQFILFDLDYDVISTERRAYIFALLKYNRSLKYKDYFTGSRTRPMAIGNAEIEVNQDVVQVIDMAKAVQKTRFWTIVNKIPRDIKGYTKGIFGTDVAPDWHNPLYLGKIREVVYGQEVENTGEAQLTEPMTRTTTLKNEGKGIRFDFQLDRNSIIIGFLSFDINRVYTRGIKRDFFHVDRYDMYNPYLQYTGDQEIYGEEYDARHGQTFGYQGNYMEFKQHNNDAFGGFITALKGWTFMDRYVEIEKGWQAENTNIGPDFIRSKPSELDRFYISLTGKSMSNYFHFIVDTYTEVTANRKMSYNPTQIM